MKKHLMTIYLAIIILTFFMWVEVGLSFYSICLYYFVKYNFSDNFTFLDFIRLFTNFTIQYLIIVFIVFDAIKGGIKYLKHTPLTKMNKISLIMAPFLLVFMELCRMMTEFLTSFKIGL